MTSVDECISDMIKHIGLVADNTYDYYYNPDIRRIVRHNEDRTRMDYAHCDINNIEDAAIKCIEIIKSRNKLK